jgi:hypothetical protein
MPEYKHVENVIRDPKISFFGIPKLGAYLAVPFKYESYIHPGVFDPVAEGGDETPEGETPAEKVNTVPVDMICALDTMGQARAFTDEEIACAQKWATLIGVNLARAERDTFLVEKVAREAAEAANAKRLESVEQDKVEQQTSAYGFLYDGRQHSHARTSYFNLHEQIRFTRFNFNCTIVCVSEMQEEIETKLKAEAESLLEGQELDESVKVLLTCEIKTRYAKDSVLACKEMLEQIKEWSIGPKAEVMKVLECAFYLLGYTQPQLYDMANRKANWSKMRGLFDSEFFNKLEEYKSLDTPATKAYADIDSMKSLLEGQDEAALSSTSLVYSALLDWAKQAIESREEAIKKKEADNEASN